MPPTKLSYCNPNHQPRVRGEKASLFSISQSKPWPHDNWKEPQPNGSGVASIPRSTRKKTGGNTQQEEEQEELIEERKLSKSRTASEFGYPFCYRRSFNAIPFITDIHLLSVRLGGGRQAGDIHKGSQSNIMCCVPMMVVDRFAWSSLSYNLLLALLPRLLYRDKFSRYFDQ